MGKGPDYVISPHLSLPTDCSYFPKLLNGRGGEGSHSNGGCTCAKIFFLYLGVHTDLS